MGTSKKINTGARWKSLDDKIEKGLQKTADKLIADQRKTGGVLIFGDKKGKIKKIPASEL